MERFLHMLRAWQRDPEIVFPLLGALVSAAGIGLFLAGAFPLSPVNFWFFSVLIFLLGLYRPSWCFLLLVSVVPFEIVAVTPDSIALSLRPYQWIFIALALALIVRLISGRSHWQLFSSSRLDYWLALIPVGALISGLIGGGQGMRLGIIVASFYALYLLGRVFLKTVGDIRIALATLFASGFMVALYGIVQNAAFEHGVNLQAVMPGRPNALFAEPDWLGFFLAFLLVIALARLAATLWNASDDLANNWVRILIVVLILLPIVIALILTVSRSAWLAAVAGAATWASATLFIRGRELLRPILQSIQLLVIVFVTALVIVIDIPLSRFDLFNRAESTATGLQEITVACSVLTNLPHTISSVDELTAFDCRHINLEDRAALQSAGFFIQTVHRPDPNVAIRSEIYSRTWKEVQTHPIFGIGWGNIGPILGADEHGSAYNASNVWLEVALGAGVIGLVGLLGAIVFAIYRTLVPAVQHRKRSGDLFALPLILAFLSIFLVFNLFNAGLLMATIWIVFAAFPALLPSKTVGTRAV